VIGDKTVLFMANHGISTGGRRPSPTPMTGCITSSAPHRFRSMRCGRKQPLKQLPDAVVEKTKRDIGGTNLYQAQRRQQRHFDALKRMLDRKEPDYAS